MVKEDVYKVTGSDINISSVQNDIVTIQGIDTRTDQEQYPPQNAIDGDLNTYFTIQGNTGESIILELDEEYEIYAVGIAIEILFPDRAKLGQRQFHCLPVREGNL